VSLGRILVREARPRRVRSLREFAEQEICIQRASKIVPFRIAAQPVAGAIFDTIDSGRWYEMYFTAPSQTAKTTICHLIPAAHAICELRENVVLGIPLDEMVDDKIRGDLFRMLERSPRLKSFLPGGGESGRAGGTGARGGKIKEKVVFSHGVEAKPMTRGSGDVGKAGYPARCVFVTEAADWSKSSETSPEAEPLEQLQARQRSFPRHLRRLIVEGTTTTAEELPWRARGRDGEALVSSRSELVSPCPHCGAWVQCERGQLRGWETAESEQEAADKAYWACPRCDHAITDDERRVSLRDVRTLHFGQKISENGLISGDLPPTHTLFMRWTAWHNCLLSTADVAVDAWKAAQLDEESEARDSAEKKLCQFVFCEPYEPPELEDIPLEAEHVKKRTGALPRDLLPEDTVHFTIGVDLGKSTCWWFAIAFRANGELHVPAYGAFTGADSESGSVDLALLNSLREFRDDVVLVGWPQVGREDRRLPDAVWIDRGYLPEVVAEFVRESGPLRSNRFMPIKGEGRSRRNPSIYTHQNQKTKTIRTIGDQWYAEHNRPRGVFEVTLSSDYWKLWLQNRLVARRHSPGALEFYGSMGSAHARQSEHSKLARQLTNERFGRDKKNKDGWTKHGMNHWLDAAAYACAAGNHCGFDLKKFAKLVDRAIEAAPNDAASGVVEIAQAGGVEFYERMLACLKSR
jgi:phage terminase large subunit GpA-like protein